MQGHSDTHTFLPFMYSSALLKNPDDDSRVPLTEIEGQLGSDYINASFISVSHLIIILFPSLVYYTNICSLRDVTVTNTSLHKV